MEVTFDASSPWAYVLVFLAAATPMVEVLLVIPAAIIAGMAPLPVALLALTGNLITVVLAIMAGDRGIAALRRWRERRRSRTGGATADPADAAGGSVGSTAEGDAGATASAVAPVAEHAGAGEGAHAAGRSGRAARLAQRWGVPGLALLGPGLTGSHVAALAALAVGARRGRVIAWMAIGLVTWVVPVTILSIAGITLFA